MRQRRILVTAVLACAVGWFGRKVYSGDAPAAPMDPAACAKLGQPGEEHARLKTLVGEWNAHGKFTTPDGKTTESDSTSSITMILGDRYLREEVKGSFMGAPFEGRGIIGFDNGSKKYVSAWIDNMGTGITSGVGEETEKGKSWTFTSTMNGPTGPTSMREVFTVVNEKELTREMFLGDAPVMSLHYVRK